MKQCRNQNQYQKIENNQNHVHVVEILLKVLAYGNVIVVGTDQVTYETITVLDNRP